jgi:outer membrane protein assembly factor BamE (lipoprotein component of BamABCDE complex)
MRVPMKILILCVLILSILGCYGCLAPTTIFIETIRKGSVDPSFIKVGVTTKEDVVLAFGNPFTVDNNERRLTYLSGFRKSAVIVVVLFVPIPADFKKESDLLHIYLDENDIVMSYTFE